MTTCDFCIGGLVTGILEFVWDVLAFVFGSLADAFGSLGKSL